VKEKAGRGAGIVVGMIMMARKSGAGNMEESGAGAGAGAGAETVTGKGGGTEEGTMTTKGVGSATVIAATGEEKRQGSVPPLHSFYQLL